MTTPSESAPARVHWIDWLRVLAVLLLFPFHVSRVFNAEPFYVKSAVEYDWLNAVLWFISTWHMQLLFFLAGASSLFALRKRSGGRYLSERLYRLMLPFLVGIFVLIPPQTWFGARFNSGYTQSFVHYLTSGDFLAWNIRDGGDFYGGFGLGHLWFLLWLLLVSLMALPMMTWLRRNPSQRLEALARRFAMPAWWIAAAALIMVGDALPDLAGLNPFYYLAFFLLGFIGAALPSFAEEAERYRWFTLAAGVVLCTWWVVSGPMRDALPDPSAQRAGLTYLGCLGTWLAILAAVGFGKRYLDRPSPALAYLAPASYPIYILHQTVIVVLAWWVVALPMPMAAQWVVLFTASVAATFAGYEILRRVPGVRVALGVK